MANPQSGEVWLVDLGLAAKVRPCLVLNITPEETERALYTLLPHTTSIRDTRFEVKASTKFLRPGAFDAQNILTIPRAKLLRKLGALPAADLDHVKDVVRLWLGL
jgi:mRNA interferase MazF